MASPNTVPLPGAMSLTEPVFAQVSGGDCSGVPDVAASANPIPTFEALRVEYLGLDHQVNTMITDADSDPRFAAMQARMKQIEREMMVHPSRSVADARSKIRFMLDAESCGVPLDGEEAHILIKDAARFLLGEEAAA